MHDAEKEEQIDAIQMALEGSNPVRELTKIIRRHPSLTATAIERLAETHTNTTAQNLQKLAHYLQKPEITLQVLENLEKLVDRPVKNTRRQAKKLGSIFRAVSSTARTAENAWPHDTQSWLKAVKILEQAGTLEAATQLYLLAFYQKEWATQPPTRRISPDPLAHAAFETYDATTRAQAKAAFQKMQPIRDLRRPFPG